VLAFARRAMYRLQLLVSNIKGMKSMTRPQIIKCIAERNVSYEKLSKKIGIGYWQLVNFALGRSINPKVDVWNALHKWARKQ
jgi:hypothetical protein